MKEKWKENNINKYKSVIQIIIAENISLLPLLTAQSLDTYTHIHTYTATPTHPHMHPHWE